MYFKIRIDNKSVFHASLDVFIDMNKIWKEIITQIGYEIKTAYQLDALGIEYKMPIKYVILNGTRTAILTKNGSILVLINEEEEHIIKRLPYVLAIHIYND